MSVDRFSVLYKISLILIVDNIITNERETLNIPNSDIVSFTIINNYDTATFPILRLRMYTDISNLEKLTSSSNSIDVRMNLDAGIYRMNEQNKSPVIVSGATNMSLALKGYIENKNTPTSIADQYNNGIKKIDDLNVNKKIPLEIYCYDDNLIHIMRQRVDSIYLNTSLESIIKSLFSKHGINNLKLEPLQNQTKYDQVISPNLNINQMIAMLDDKYGLYDKGGHIYGDIDGIYICNSNVYYGYRPLPIYIESYKNNSDIGGLKKIKDSYFMNTSAVNVSVISETDIARVLNADTISSIDLNTLKVNTTPLMQLFPETQSDMVSRVQNNSSGIEKYIKRSIDNKIITPNLLYKTMNKFILETTKARITECITKVDISGVGFDVGKMKISSRYNLIFESPIRGMSINQPYRATNISHVFTNLDSNLFIAQTVMNLCSN